MLIIIVIDLLSEITTLIVYIFLNNSEENSNCLIQFPKHIIIEFVFFKLAAWIVAVVWVLQLKTNIFIFIFVPFCHTTNTDNRF